MARTGHQPRLRPGWLIQPTRIGYCTDTNCAYRFWCGDENVDLMSIQPRVGLEEPCHQYKEAARRSSWAIDLCLSITLPKLLTFIHTLTRSDDESLKRKHTGRSRWSTIISTNQRCLVIYMHLFIRCYCGSSIAGSRVYGNALATSFTHYPIVKSSVVGTRVLAVL